ncbi:Major vault protein [Phytophthora cinnamomi]|uniref:Major vault protein n=1 Tax=Phytophthora cinnamomi TaxID=4785 RepID=UPI00355AC071|nr:Major vault protein [Phytophthora cinnamomi]
MLSTAYNNKDGGPRVIRLPPYKYVHVLDTNSNVSRVLAGPLTYTRQEHEHVMTPPQNMIVLPAQHYVEVRNPVVRSEDGKIVRDAFDQAKLKHGEIEFRIFDKYPEPFPLYPGEEQVGEIRQLRVVAVDTALRIRATRKIDKYVAGDEWLFVGPKTYYPRVEEEIVDVVHAVVIKKNQAIKFRAEKKCTDSQGIERDAGEEWLVRTPGAYLPQIDEVHVETLQAHILTLDTALHLRASRTFKDVYGISRRAGEEWLITTETTETHVQDVHEEILGYVNITILTNRQYCIVVDPVVNGVQRRGTRELRKGEASFFLQPGEQLENGRVEDICVLADDEAVLLQAVESFMELPEEEWGEPEGEDGGNAVAKKKSSAARREAGERWMVHGPREYIPPIQVKVLETRRAIPLDVNEGVYVRERKTGHVRAVKGETYMLQPTEELWAKQLQPAVEELLSSQACGSAYVTDPTLSNKLVASLGRPWDASKGLPPQRDPTRVVTFEVPHNAGIQVYDYKTTSSRILFGPTLVMLEPDEQFTVLRLSGGVPKEPNVIRTLCLQLGPDFMRDQIIVETSDHARLSLTIAYNWRFRVDSTKPADAAKIFNVKDFTGDACKTLASRIRGAVAVQDFDYFHKHSAQIIRTSIFGLDENKKLRDELVFPANNLCITNVDIQSAEPVDQLTRQSLQKSVQLAIEITTKSQEARAKAIAMKEEEAAKGELLTQQLENQSSAEQARKNLVQLTAECKAVEEEAAAVSRARAQAQAAEIEGQAAVRQAELRAKAESIEHEAHVTRIKEDQMLSVAHAERLAEVEVRKKRELMAIEAEKFQQMVSSVGQDTLVALARAGPDGQVKMLEALGLSGYLITDGKSPVNLLGTAEGIIRGISQAEQ